MKIKLFTGESLLSTHKMNLSQLLNHFLEIKRLIKLSNNE